MLEKSSVMCLQFCFKTTLFYFWLWNTRSKCLPQKRPQRMVVLFFIHFFQECSSSFSTKPHLFENLAENQLTKTNLCEAPAIKRVLDDTIVDFLVNERKFPEDNTVNIIKLILVWKRPIQKSQTTFNFFFFYLLFPKSHQNLLEWPQSLVTRIGTETNQKTKMKFTKQ